MRPCPPSASASRPSCPRVSSLPLFGLAGSRIRKPEVVVRRFAERLREHCDDLRRPEELVLEVDEPPGRTKSA